MELHLRFFVLILVVVLGAANSSSSNECGQIKLDDNPFPWNVGIYLNNENQLELICLGSIIHSKAILTAAHCFYDDLKANVRNVSFYVATANLEGKFDSKKIPANVQKIHHNDIFIQKHYKGILNFYKNDLAVVKTRFQLNDNIKPVCFDWSAEIQDTSSEGKQSAWHKDKIINIEQSYLTSDDCSSEVPQDFVTFVTSDKYCAKVKTAGVQLNHNSEGAGLVFLNSNDNRWYLKGVISMIETKQGVFSTYTFTNQFLNWISNICATL